MQTKVTLTADETKKAVQEFVTKKGLAINVTQVTSGEGGTLEVVGEHIEKKPIVRQKKPVAAAAANGTDKAAVPPRVAAAGAAAAKHA